MKVAYIGDLKISDRYGYRDWLYSILFRVAEVGCIDFVVLCGGISDDYMTTIQFVDTLGKRLSDENCKLRFIFGNTDLYYDRSVGVVDKEKKVSDIIKRYRENQYYLPHNPILTRDTRILGFESWYDYSLYRGKPIDLSKISKKSRFISKNQDVTYITDKDDYMVGLSNMFDIRYNNQCLDLMRSQTDDMIRRHGVAKNMVACMYFKTSKIFLDDRFLFGKFFNSYEGSLSYHQIMRSRNINQCVFGKSSSVKSKMIDGIKYSCCHRKISEEIVINEYS